MSAMALPPAVQEQLATRGILGFESASVRTEITGNCTWYMYMQMKLDRLEDWSDGRQVGESVDSSNDSDSSVP